MAGAALTMLGVQSAMGHNATPDWGHRALGHKGTLAQMMPTMPRRLRVRPRLALRRSLEGGDGG